MGLLCNCPAGAAIPDVPIEDCFEDFGQLQKVIIQRVNASTGTKNTIATPTVKASWTPLLAAADGTKVVQSPFIEGPTTEPGAAKTWGGGNDTLGGTEIIIGRESTKFTGMINRKHQKTIKALKEMTCETVGVWLIDEYGRIGCLADDPETPTAYYPIPIRSFFVGDKKLGGLDTPDSNEINWQFFPNWSDNFVVLEPTDFDALSELATPA